MSLCRSRLRLKPLAHRSNRSVSVTERKPYAVVSDPHRYLTGLDKLPSNRYIYRFTEPSEGPSLEGCRVKKRAGTITLSSEEGEVLIAQVHQSNLPAAAAGGEWATTRSPLFVGVCSEGRRIGEERRSRLSPLP